MNPHTAHSHSKPHTSNPGTSRMSSQNQGGRPMTMVVGMATVAAGLGAFWMLQFRTQNRTPAEIPTSKNPKGSSSGLSHHDGPERHGKGILASILTVIHGDPKDTQNDDGHVGQPAPIRRLNDRGGVYTKNSEFKDSYRRE
ncbi:hypothetical protein LXA43DRAFT_1116760 [Ganoderma leucocontextum]|nr:hypothetical protein LXA43DRAFT_1116760 [Ganoderma leucocontextum]